MTGNDLPRTDALPPAQHRAARQAQGQLHAYEAHLAPEAFLQQIRIERSLGHTHLANLMAQSRTGRDLAAARSRLQPYRGQDIAPSATLFEGTGPRSARRLLVTFSGKLGRMMPAALYLQCLPATDWDVLILRDRTGLHFQLGAPGLAQDFPELGRAIARMGSAYAGLAALGISMGGFCAIRLSLQIGPFRALSVSGRPVTDAARLLVGEALPPAFDPICACLSKAPRPHLLYAHSEDHLLDKTCAETACAMTGGEVMAVPGHEHTLFWTLYTDGLLPEFLSNVFCGPT